jgi:hypothetical protein
VVQADFVPPREEITTDYQDGELKSVMLARRQVKLLKVASTTTPLIATGPTRTSATTRRRARS